MDEKAPCHLQFQTQNNVIFCLNVRCLCWFNHFDNIHRDYSQTIQGLLHIIVLYTNLYIAP